MWLMRFNPIKCQVIRITNKPNPVTENYTIRGHILEVVPHAKYLGVSIDSKLSFNAHVDATVKKANGTRAFLSRNLSRCSRKVKEASYFGYVRPIVEYAATAWDPHTTKNIDKVEMVQRRCARYVTSNYARTSSVSSMLEDLNWPTLQTRRHNTSLAMMYRIRYGLVDIRWEDHLSGASEATLKTRGHSSRFTLPHCKTQVYASSFIPRTSRDWNNLKIDPSSFATLKSFKVALRVTP